MPGQREQLNVLLEQLTAQRVQIEQGKLAASQGMSQAAVQLALAEQTLAAQKTEFEKARDAAYEKADISGIFTKDMLAGLLAANNFSMPAGYIDEDGARYAVKVGDLFSSENELANLLLTEIDAADIGKVRLSDIATIEKTDNAEDSYARINGYAGVLLSFQKQSTTSTSEASGAIRDTIAALEAKYEGLHITPLMDQGIYIDIVIESVLQNLLMGAVLAVIVLLIFLRDMRPTLIVAASIPISLMLAIVLMYFTGRGYEHSVPCGTCYGHRYARRQQYRRN